MSTSCVKAYAAKGVGHQLEPVNLESPALGEHDVRVSITHCGLCYTDVQGIDDFYGITKYPFVPGHEIVGKVSEVGAAVINFKPGDRIGIGWLGRPCMQCEWCLQGQEQMCLHIVKAATWRPYGGFSSAIILDSRYAYHIPQAMPSEVAAVLMCAGISVYNPLSSNAATPPRHIGIVGVGGLGHLAIQFARAMGYEVTALSSSPSKMAEAISLGADHFLSMGDKAAMEEREFTFDLLLCTAHGIIDWVPLIDTLKKRGKLILVGFSNLELNTTDLLAHELAISGSFLGSVATMKEMLAFAQEHSIKPWVELMPMTKINDAIQRLKQNQARYRIVLYNENQGA